MTDNSIPAATNPPFQGGEREVEALRESQRMLSSLLQNLPGIAFRMLVDEQWTVRFISAGCYRLTGYTPEDLVGNKRVSFESLTHLEDRARIREKILAALAARRAYEVVYRLINAAGEERWVWERGQGITADDGSVKFLEGFITDITERHDAEEKVKAQAALLDKARDAILVTDLDGYVTYCNQSAQALLGSEAGSCCQTSIDNYLTDEAAGLAGARAAVLARGEWSGELAARSGDGRGLVLESRWTLVRDDQGAPKSILMINTDETERKALEAQFLRAQRMESIGTLAGGIAHDLNNILSPILTSLELIRAALPRPEDHELVDIVEASANRGAEMVKQILLFARGAEGRRSRLALGVVFRGLEKIIRETFPRNMSVEVRPVRDLWPVLGDATQIHQLLLNLCVNARDAMPGGGTLTIQASNVAEAGEVSGPGVLLEVTDTGCGIPEEIRDKVFDPFFTTKKVGEGTGLGLSTVQVIVKNHGGSVHFESESGKGSTFRVLLPAATSAGTERTEADRKAPPSGRGEMVLVVDDESSVRSVTQRTLESFGYRVVVAKNGSDGLAAFARNQAEITAVITDLMMPVMDGPAMIRELRLQAPALPIIAVTGLVAAENLDRVREAGVQMILAKPYTAETILHALAGLLGRA